MIKTATYKFIFLKALYIIFVINFKMMNLLLIKILNLASNRSILILIEFVYHLIIWEYI
jgi:hypothetical protein